LSHLILQANLLSKDLRVALNETAIAQAVSSAFLFACVFWNASPVIHASCLVVATTSTNLFTIVFNSLAQQLLPADMRGRFLASLISLANLAGAAGALLFAFESRLLLWSTLIMAVVARMALLEFVDSKTS
jgi:hypothetical protein